MVCWYGILLQKNHIFHVCIYFFIHRLTVHSFPLFPCPIKSLAFHITNFFHQQLTLYSFQPRYTFPFYFLLKTIEIVRSFSSEFIPFVTHTGLRGAIAIILSLTVETVNKTLIINTTFAIVLITNLLCGYETLNIHIYFFDNRKHEILFQFKVNKTIFKHMFFFFYYFILYK